MARSISPQASWPATLDPYVPVPALADETIRLAFNETPLGPFPDALEAIVAAAGRANRYPEQDGELIRRLAELHGLTPGMIALGNGADAVIGYLSSAFLRPGDEVITGWPSFPTYLSDAVKQEAVVKLAPLSDGAFDLDAVAELISPRTRLIWVCTPNNPTGGVVRRADFRRFVDTVPERVLVVVDEAYHEFAAGPEQLDCVAEYVRERPNVAALRTFSKLYGLAGLRVGYLAGPESVVTAVAKSRHYYDLTGLSAVAALASLASPDEVQRRRRINAQQRAALEAALSEHGWHSYPSHANFLAVEVGDADATAERLLASGVATRSLSGLGAPELLRVTVGTDAECARLVELLGRAGVPAR
ncbi:MAG: histidinol-phosphate transaminase [Solirubrobacteraceae bacterium]